MTANDYIRAWKDPDYRASLSAEQRVALPAHPCAEVELSDEVLEQIAGAANQATDLNECGLSCLCTATWLCCATAIDVGAA